MDMIKCRTVNFLTMHEVYEFAKRAEKVEGDVEIRSGKYVINGKSLMGILSLDWSLGAEVYFLEKNKEFDAFLADFD